jgi:hypothetical protein
MLSASQEVLYATELGYYSFHTPLVPTVLLEEIVIVAM